MEGSEVGAFKKGKLQLWALQAWSGQAGGQPHPGIELVGLYNIISSLNIY